MIVCLLSPCIVLSQVVMSETFWSQHTSLESSWFMKLFHLENCEGSKYHKV